MVLALVLGPLAEQSLRQTLTISRGSLGIFIERQASLWILGATVVNPGRGAADAPQAAKDEIGRGASPALEHGLALLHEGVRPSA